MIAQSLKTLRVAYGYSEQSFRRALKPIKEKLDKCAGRKSYRILSPKQVEIIIDFLGEPDGFILVYNDKKK